MSGLWRARVLHTGVHNFLKRSADRDDGIFQLSNEEACLLYYSLAERRTQDCVILTYARLVKEGAIRCYLFIVINSEIWGEGPMSFSDR